MHDKMVSFPIFHLLSFITHSLLLTTRLLLLKIKISEENDVMKDARPPPRLL